MNSHYIRCVLREIMQEIVQHNITKKRVPGMSKTGENRGHTHPRTRTPTHFSANSRDQIELERLNENKTTETPADPNRSDENPMTQHEKRKWKRLQRIKCLLYHRSTKSVSKACSRYWLRKVLYITQHVRLRIVQKIIALSHIGQKSKLDGIRRRFA